MFEDLIPRRTDRCQAVTTSVFTNEDNLFTALLILNEKCISIRKILIIKYQIEDGQQLGCLLR